MDFNDITLIIIILWILSEIILALIKHSGSKSSDLTDKNSLRIIWITIAISTFFGGFIGSTRSGHIYGFEYISKIIGLVLIASGIVFRWTAIITLRKFFTVDVAILSDHRIVKKGMYKFMRHPAYSGSLLSFVGLGIFWCNWLSFLVIFLPIFAAFSYRINVEEKALIKNFGEEYINYSKETKKLLPKIY
ncbi:MAG: isoprenylcysteine carboxylmethyltransferase family protein [Ignavibacteria bacterium]|jgi:protein-S-isoprenylcysteine O-methyltransferase Ste14